ncbi:hypothetical protein BD560DRAFT_487190 [Blakeslea trispora]|nr:hypothetical protein BD560DRAFT_487190 [Blakeslea trispora]
MSFIKKNSPTFRLSHKDELVAKKGIKALEYRERYHTSTASEKGVVSLGLNSILGVSFNCPDCQSKLFTNQEWHELRKRYRPVAYNITEYDKIKSILKPVFQAYKENKTFDTNWMKMYKEAKKLEKHYDPVLKQKYADIAFCIFFVTQVLSIVRYNSSLFDAAIDSSEWDFVVKFWGPITERLFQDSELRLKWGDTHLTLNDTVSEAALKVDLRVINDKMKQRYNIEHDIAVLEAAAEDAGNATIIDNYLLDGALLCSVNSLQVSGLDIYILNTTLEEPGLYVTKELYCRTISKSLASLASYLDLALQLLCFRDDCVSKSFLLKQPSNPCRI